MTFDDYLRALGYSTYGDSNVRYRDASGENISPQALEQLQGSFNQFNQTDAQGRPVYGTEAYRPGTMSDAYGQGLFRLGQADAGPQLGPILQNMGASVQYDPRYGYVIPQAAQDEWSRQYGQPKGFDAFLENLASNAPIALGGAVLGAGLGYGPFAGGSLEGGAAAGGGSGIGGGFGGAELGSENMDLLDWINSNWDSVAPSQTDLGSFSSDMFGAGDISPDWWSNIDPSNGWGTDEIGGVLTPDETIGSAPANSWLNQLTNSLPNSLKNLFGGSGGTGVNLGSLLGGTSGIGDLLSRGLAVAPSLAAINYARNQTPFDTSKLENIYSQYSPSGQTFQYDQASGAGRGQLASNLERRGIMGSSFGDQSLANYDTTRTLGRNALLNQGATTQANIANSIIQAQAKDRELKNTLYGSALYALAGGLAPRTRV